jgi:pimeloyl-ACP methyl ester carboxylesterase
MVIAVDGIELHYDVHGEGRPLVWLHGFLGSGADWRHVFPEPPAGYRLFGPDMRGHGASTPAPVHYSHRRCALDVLALLDHLGIASAQAIGLSGGGITLLHLATLAPQRFESIVLVSAPPYFPAQARALQQQFSEAMLSEDERRRLRERHKHGEAQIEWLFAQARAFASSYEDVSFTPPHLATITARTLIVFGDRDPLYPVSLATEMREAIPRSYLWVVPNGGHGPIFGPAAPAFASTALSFLRGEWETPS